MSTIEPTRRDDHHLPGYSRRQAVEEPRLLRSPVANGLVLFSGPILAVALPLLLPNTYDFGGEVRLLEHSAKISLGLMIWMAIWWLTQCVPLWVTSIIPLIVCPLFGVADWKRTAMSYGDPTIRLFLGGFLLSAAIARWKLGERFSLLVLSAVGSRPSNLIGGLMFVTAALSAFVSNAATTTMMFPIALSIAHWVRQQTIAEADLGDRFGGCAMLGVAYAASLGGMITILGTPPNMLLVGFMRDFSNIEQRLELSFTAWLGIGPPIAIILLPLCWLLLTRFVFRLPQINSIAASAEVRQRLSAMGKPDRAEWATLMSFIFAIAFWIWLPWIRELRLGASNELVFSWLKEWHVGMLAAGILFLVPAPSKRREPETPRMVLGWRDFFAVPWGVLLLFGGGLALSSSINETGADKFLAANLNLIEDWPRWLAMTVIIVAVVFFSEIASNTAAVATLLPIFGALSESWNVHPATLTVPITLAASCGFMMPVATPPNAIVFSSGLVRAKDMMHAGWWLNWAGIVVISLLSGWLVDIVLL